ncbi:MAG: transposase [Deltaproteobacteria bacterium]|nr:transposase [Deltaproteobacteria bacterium]
MTRPWRIEYDGAIYHVLSRGNERRDIFYDEQDRDIFLALLGEISRRFEIEVFAYVLMDNHYHLLLRIHQANLSKAMQWLGVTYTRRFNLKHCRSGHLFQGRFKSMLIENDAYLMQLSCYIHRNPLRAGLVNRLADYSWSSYPAYAYGKSSPLRLSMEMILGQFAVRDKHRAYRVKVQGYASEESRLWEDFRHGLVLGARDFVDELRMKYLSGKPHKEVPQQKRVAAEIDPQDLLKRVSVILKCDPIKFKQSKRLSSLEKEDRDLLFFLIWSTGRFTNQKIGDLFDLTYSSVSHSIKSVKSRIKEDPIFQKKIETINSQIKM